MRILVVGAGAVGGYFGGRLVEKGEDVTFLVREGRRKQLAEQGLVIKSLRGDFTSSVKVMSSGEAALDFDLVMLAVKSYHLGEAIEDVKPYVGSETAVLPLLNGYAHYERLRKEFGEDKVLGGLVFIESTMGPKGEIVHTSQRENLVFGEWHGVNGQREELIYEHLSGAGFTVILSPDIQREIWKKYTFIASLAGVTTLLNSPLGPIRSDELAYEVYCRLLDEIIDIACRSGYPADEKTRQEALEVIASSHETLDSSMHRDMKKGLPVEADHFYGFLLDRAGKDAAKNYPLLAAVYANLRLYLTCRTQ